MAALVVDILWRTLAWGIAGAGVLAILHALLGDWLAGVRQGGRVRRAAKVGQTLSPRRRCPGGWGRVLFVVPVRVGCWYDMTAAEPGGDGRLLCPECGRRSTPRRLRASRRNWGMVLMGVLVVAMGLGGRYSRELYRRGWKAVPDEVLVLVPFDERKWIENGTTGSHWLIEEAASEIAARDRAETLSAWASAWLGRRVQARYRRDPDYGVSDASFETLVRLESTPFTGGLDRVPFEQGVRRIAEAAGIGIEVDREALERVNIDPDRPITVPAFTSMTCAQALHWACDRARATSGWGVGAWDLRDGAVLVSDESSLAVTKRALVLALRRGPVARAALAVSLTPSLDLRATTTRGDAVVVIAPERQIAQAERFGQAVVDATQFPIREDEPIITMHARLRLPLDSTFAADDSITEVIARVRAELGIRVGVDPWGLDATKTLMSRDVAAMVDGMQDGWSSDSTDPRQAEYARYPIVTPAAALDRLEVEYVHDGGTLIVGLRAWGLLSGYAVYRLPETRPEGPTFQSFRTGQPNARLAEWDRRIVELRGRVPEASESRSFSWRARVVALQDRLILVGPPDFLALAAPIVEQWLAEWSEEPGGSGAP